MMRRSIVLLLPLLLAGCGFLSSKPSRFYSLDRIPPAAASSGGRGLPIGVEVVLPPGVDRKEIVVRQADHQLEVRGREQWTATLEPLVLHTLAFDLADRLPEGMVIFPGQAKAGAMRELEVAFEELAPGPERTMILDARWTVHESGRPDVTRHEHIAIDLASLDSAEIATGVSKALAALADRIVAGMGGGT
jgi:uncharacterized lipoprotein YmbA